MGVWVRVAGVAVLAALFGCTPTENNLGRNRPVREGPDAGMGGAGTGGAGTGGAGAAGAAGVAGAPIAGAPPVEIDAGPTMPPVVWPAARTMLPNLFVDVLGLTVAEVDDKIETVFQQLFHGDPDTEAIYVDVGGREAYIHDVFHDDTRMDAVGYGMMITVELNKQAEFDAVWKFARRRLRYQDGPAQGFFHGTCALGDGPCEPEAEGVGVFGSIYAATALLFADARWSSVGEINYAAEAREYITLLETSALAAGTGVRVFDPMARLPYSAPEMPMGRVASNDLIPAFYQFWAGAMDSEFWGTVADSSRALFDAAAHPETGLVPSIVLFDGELVDGNGTFDALGYHSAFHLAVDAAWYGLPATPVDIIDLQVAFFSSMNREIFAGIYDVDGTIVDTKNDAALTMLIGAAAGVVMSDERAPLIQRVWDYTTPTGTYRYFDGANYLISLLFLSGKFRPWL